MASLRKNNLEVGDADGGGRRKELDEVCEEIYGRERSR